MATFFRSVKTSFKRHPKVITVIVIACLVGAYGISRSVSSTNTGPQYTLAVARLGTLTQTVAGTGQVSASNQTDIQSQVSGTILSIRSKVGDSVHTGDLIATIDPKNAAISLATAKLSLAKLVEPPKATDLSNAQSSLTSSYTNAFNAAANIYLDLPSIMSGMKTILYGQGTFLSDQRSSTLTSDGRSLRDTTGRSYDAAALQYQDSLNIFKNVTRSSATSSIDDMLNATYATIKSISQTVTNAQNTVTYITTSQPDYDAKDATTASSDVNGWASLANGDLSALASAMTSIKTANNSLTTLVQGSDSLDIESAKLSVAQAQQTYDNYFVRAPYDGTIGRIPVNVYGQAGASTVIATIIGAQKIATISLDEVDAAQVKVGQPVAITFDAINNFSATGTVEQVDQVGTVSSGVVSYGVKILINTTDDRIKPGMSVNTTITTKQESGVLLVPTVAVKTSSGTSYVQTLPRSVLASLATSTAGNANLGQFASSTRRLAMQNRDTASTSSGMIDSANSTTASGFTSVQTASSSYGGTFGSSSAPRRNASAQTRTFTVASTLTPQSVTVKTGDSDSTNTVITSGLNPGDLVVTRTAAASTASTAAAPSILSSFGARTGGAAPRAATTGR